ncbi:polysaccharide deacetylase family protein [Ornithinibacillus caprae]|nr:polysaccharide deacetylase family protein [Ornithinibacillus caprae]
MMRQLMVKFSRKVIFLTIILILFSNLLYAQSSAADQVKVLVIYSSENGEVDEHQRLLDLLIGHFTSSITFVSSAEVKAKDVSEVTHLIYYGQVPEELPSSLVRLLDSYHGPVLGIGYNVEQITSHFSYVDSMEMKIVNDVTIKRGEQEFIKVNAHPIVTMTIDQDLDVLVEMNQKENNYPLFMKQNDIYYYATPNLFGPVATILADELHTFFDMSHESSSTYALLRLEDIHPRTDAEVLEEIAMFLHKKNIPYMVSVTPVYVNPLTEEEYHLSETPKLLKVLEFMQRNGASIVLHGYTDQYGEGKTGDGFEFWDVDKNSPMMEELGTNIETNFYTISGTGDMIDRNKLESFYIENRITRGIHELVDYGIYPIAFEAPHYAMSQNGYEVISNYFSTYVGQVQLTDEDWRIMTEAPNITTPSFLNGMKLIPETIRYIRYEDPTSIQEMKERIDEFTMVRDGIIGGFYHPFLGSDGLKDLVHEMERIPDLEWINVNEMDHRVETDRVIITMENGKATPKHLKQEDKEEESKWLQYFLSQVSSESVLWISIGGGITITMVLITYLLLGRVERSL